MTAETAAADTTTEVTPEPEVKNPAALLAKNRALLDTVASLKAELQAARQALEAAQGAETAWRDRVYQSEVLKPLEAELREVSAAPWKYARDTCDELGLLKMEPGADGFDRPVWYDEKGEPADLRNGLYHFLSDVYRRTGGDVGDFLRGTGASGGGAGGVGRSSPYIPDRKPVKQTSLPPMFGLR